MPIKTATLLRCGVLAALCWSVADMLLVGFVPHPELYPRLLALDAQLAGDGDFAALMLDASPARLFFGVIPATFSLIGYLAACAGLARLLTASRTSHLALALLFGSYALLPLAHAGFYYLGHSAQTLLAVDDAAVPLLLAQYNAFYQLLQLHWLAAIALAAAGWLLVTVQIARRRSTLPRSFALLTPLPLAVLIGFACSAFPTAPLAALLGGATFNLAQLVFYAAVCWRLR